MVEIDDPLGILRILICTCQLIKIILLSTPWSALSLLIRNAKVKVLTIETAAIFSEQMGAQSLRPLGPHRFSSKR